ncbi:MAG TPA: bifunctional diguanylate cyclase/phosphodiesterase [Steroidobacteraceae bacterium]|nr:bifunctional diguanylate cyclase/phosphodiesterase [Steroidobacteraceae bacterium]
MRPSFLRRYSHWLLPFLAAATVLVIGARLITVGVTERSRELHRAAQTAVVSHARLIDAQLLTLLDQARRDADQVPATGIAATSAPAVSGKPDTGAFWMSSAGTVVAGSTGTPEVAGAIAQEWAGADGAARGGGGALFGPVRYGSQWLVAARAQVPARAGESQASAAYWTVSYVSLDALLQRADFGSLVKEGYDFQLSQPDPLARVPRVFLSSRAAPLEQPSLATVFAPPAVAGTPGRAFLTLAVRPKSGWYPARELSGEIGLLALLAWALAFGAYDLTHSLKRTQSVLATTRERLHDANERLAGEIEQRENLQKSFEHARYHDAFTGLPNRRYFMDQLDRTLRDLRRRRRRRIAIALIDIERLRLISDTLGHTAGDELLLQAAQRCAAALVGTEHVLARFGVSQLAVLASEVDSPAAAQALADRLQQARQEPFELRQHRLSITSRVGFTCLESGVQRAEDALREADLALSVAKQQQSQRAVAYVAGMGGAAVSLVSLEADLHVALDRREFRLLYQPIVDLRAQRAVGVEALLRWWHPVEGLLTPDRFLAIAEESGVIVPVTRWIITRVCRLAAEWRTRLPQGDDFYISVNLSAAVLRAPGLSEYVAQALAEAHLPAHTLKFELSEGGLISNVTTARAVLDAFHDMGIELMLDDFGTGYSSLSYLQLFPFDYVKVDRPFVSRTGSERANQAITSAILQMASNLGLRAVAEIVETQAAAQTLMQMGCEYGQGYFFSPPVEAEEAFRQLRSAGGFQAQTAGQEHEPLPEDSPTVMLPAGMIIESRITDTESDAEHSAG